MKEQRIKLIGKLLHQQGNTARAFVQYMDSDREYTAGDKLYMREAHFVIAIGPGEGRTMSEIAREMNVTQGAVSQIASRLEKKGYVCRRKNEENKDYLYNGTKNDGQDHSQRTDRRRNERGTFQFFSWKLRRTC